MLRFGIHKVLSTDMFYGQTGMDLLLEGKDYRSMSKDTQG